MTYEDPNILADEMHAAASSLPLRDLPAAARAFASRVRQLVPLLASVKDLLAVIHRDGGHHTEALGLHRSIYDAREKWVERERELGDTKAEMQRLRRKYGEY